MIMDYKNKDKAVSLINAIERREEELKVIEEAKQYGVYHDMTIVITNGCNGEKELSYPAKGEVREFLISKKMQEIQDDIEGMKRILEQL